MCCCARSSIYHNEPYVFTPEIIIMSAHILVTFNLQKHSTMNWIKKKNPAMTSYMYFTINGLLFSIEHSKVRRWWEWGHWFFFLSFFVKEILSFRLNLAFPDIGSLLREVSYLVAEKLDGVNEDKGKPR